MLLGVRGSSRESEGQPTHEGIMQQPGSFYIGNPSSSIWGNPPTPPLWRNSSLNNVSSSASSSLASSSSFPSSSTRVTRIDQQEHHSQWQHHAREEQNLDQDQSDKDEQEAATRRAAENRFSQGTPQRTSNVVGPSVSNPVTSPFTFGFPSQTTSFVLGANAAVPCQFLTTNVAQEKGVDTGLFGNLPGGRERGMGLSVGTNFNLNDHKGSRSGKPVLSDQDLNQGFVFGRPYSVEDLAKEWESRLQVNSAQSSILRPTAASQSSSTSQPVTSTFEAIPSKDIERLVSNSAGLNMAHLYNTIPLSASMASGSFSVDTEPVKKDGLQPSSSQKEGHGVFVFGASGASRSSGVQQQKVFPASVTGSVPRSRVVKVKKNSSFLKGKGALAVAGIGLQQQVASEFDSSAFSNADLDVPEEASHFDDVQCLRRSDAGIQPLNNQDSESGRSESLQGLSSSKSEVPLEFGADKSNVKSVLQSKDRSGTIADEYQPIHDIEQQVSRSEKREKEHLEQMRNVGEHFHSWHPFSSDMHEDHTKGNKQVSSKNNGVELRSGLVDDTVCAGSADEVLSDIIAEFATFGKPLGKQEKTGSSFDNTDAASDAEGLAEKLPHQDESAADGFKFSDGFSSKSFVQEDSKSDLKYESLFEQFSRLGRFSVSLNGQKENQEPVHNAGNKDFQKPFVFGASRSIPKPVSSTGQVDSRPDTPLHSDIMKNENSKADKLKKTASGGMEESIIHDFLRTSGSGCTSTTLFTANNAVGSDFNDAVFNMPSSTSSQPSSTFPEVSSSHTMRQSSSVQATRETPIGEFSGPRSSSESSDSEWSPIRGEQGAGTDVPFNLNHSFAFRGSNKGISAGMAARKKKAHGLSSNLRRQSKRHSNKGKRIPRAQGGLYTSFPKTADSVGSPMDFSHQVEMEPQGASPLGAETNEVNSEQPSFWGATAAPSVDSEEDYKEVWQNLVEDSHVEGLRVAAANLSMGNDTSKGVFQECNGLSFGQSHEWMDSNISLQRNGKWKRSAFEEEESASTGLENPWMNSQSEKETEDEADLYSHATLNGEGSNQRKRFTFMANSPPTLSSSMLRRHSRRIQRERAVDAIKQSSGVAMDPILATSGVDALKTAGLGHAHEITTASQGIFHGPSLMVDEKGQARAGKVVASVNSNQSVSNNKNATKKVSTKMADLEPSIAGQRFDSGMPASPNAVKSAAAEQVCERWRLRGNQAYANGDFPKAEEYYSRGASSVSPNETSQSCIRASMLCYSNRAATRMAVGRMREALADCMRAIVVDPSFLRVRLRAASCHIALGESKAAATIFKECLKYAKEGSQADSKIAAEAIEGLKKTQQLDEYSDRASELLAKANATDSTSALRLINEALLFSPYSERLLEMKVQSLFSLRRHEEVVQLCEQSLSSAERNHGSVVNEQQHQDVSFGEPSADRGNTSLKLWRWRMSAKSLFQLGRLDESLTLLMKHEKAISTSLLDKSPSTESLAPFISNICDLLRHKSAGNEAFQAGKHAEAVEHYTAALACNGDSRPYNAVCFCNRAAASQALGHVADAIADCSRAIALDSDYPKAISRRATLHEMVRDYGQVCNDLRRLVTLLESHQNGKSGQSSRVSGANNNAHDLKQARDRLVKAEEEMQKDLPVDHYLILGVDFSCSANEIKKAYRKAALKHHPDKAGQFLARGENGDDGSVWKEVGDDVRRDAERLFKMIGEAYAVLSDPTKRCRYDREEEVRKLKGNKDISSVSGTSQAYRSQYEKGGRRQRDRWDSWNGYAPQYQRWQSGPDAAQPDTYADRSNYGATSSKFSKYGGRTTAFDWDEF